MLTCGRHQRSDTMGCVGAILHSVITRLVAEALEVLVFVIAHYVNIAMWVSQEVLTVTDKQSTSQKKWSLL